MSSTTVSQLKELLEKLEALNVQEPNPQLESQLAAVVAAAQAEIDHQQRRENDPKVQLESLGAPEDLRPLSSTADMNLLGSVDGDNPELQIAHQAVPRPHFRVKTNSCLPFLAIEMEGGSDPRDAFLDRNQPPQFGTPLIGVHPLEPPLDLFVWPEASMSTEGKPAHDKLEPAPSMKAPFIGYFPQAPVYMLNSERDRSYRRGWRYAAPFYTSDREEQKQNMLNVRMPDNVAPTHFDTATRSFVASPIPGMIRAPLGIPLVHHIHGDAKRAVTAVCVHTLETVMQYPQGPEIHELARQLVDLTWGQDPSGDRPLQYGIFEIPGMKTNLRSKHVGNAPAGDGSFNIASTHGEGEGFGHFGPAVQTDTAEAAPIKSILKILHRLYRLVMPLCISRFEWEFMEMNGYENNVLAFGGLEPGPTSCQVNSSSAANVVDLDVPSVEEDNVPLPSNPSRRARVEEVDDEDDNPSSHLHPTSSFVILEEIETESPPTQDVFTLIDLTDLIYTELKKAGALDTSIGTQGKPHGDFKDDPGWFTLFVLQFRLPPGSDMGPFLWMRSAIYVRETDQYILFMAFKGQDIHTGSAPTYIKRFMDDFPSSDLGNKLFKRFGTQVRVGYVMYPSSGATSHDVQQLYTPSLHLLYSPGDSRAGKRRYYIPHGHTVMGDSHARANRLAREGAYALKNYFLQCGINLGLGVNALLKNSTFTDASGAIRHIEPAPIDIEDEEVYQTLCLCRRFHFWWKGVMSEYALGVTKPKFKERQAQIKDILAGYVQPRKGLPTERKMIRLPHKSAQSSNPVPHIEKIVSRRQNAGKGIWTIVLEGNSDEVEYTEEEAEKLRSIYNDQKFQTYLNQYGTGPPPPSSTGRTQPKSSDTERAPASRQPETLDPPLARKSTKRKHAVISDSEEDQTNKPARKPAKGGTRKAVPKSGRDRRARTPAAKSAKSSHNTLTSDSESEDDQIIEPLGDVPEFGVASIIDWRHHEGHLEWLVNWKDYDESYNEWLNAEELSGSQELLKDFNDRHNVFENSEYSPTPTPPSSDDEFRPPGLNSNTYDKRRGRRVELTADSSEVWKPKPKPVDGVYLKKLLNSVELQKECAAMTVAGNILERTSDHKRVTDSPENVATRIIQHIEQQSTLGTQMTFELPASVMGSEAWSPRLAGMTLRCISDLGSTLPEMVALSHIHDLISRGAAGQICRALVAIYQWLVHLGPSLAEQLTSLLRDKGLDMLQEKFPELAPAVVDIVAFVHAHQEWQQQQAAVKRAEKAATAPQGRRKKRRVGEHSNAAAEKMVTAGQELPNKVKAPSSDVPGDLWGLLATGKASAKIRLRPLPANITLKSNEL